MGPSGRRRLLPVEAAVGLLVAVAVLGPVLPRGYVLSYDMVFVPRQPLGPEQLGVASFAPRAVPSDLVIGLLARVAPADVVQKAVLVAVLVAAAWGAGAAWRAVTGSGREALLGPAVAAVAYGWTPFLYERLLLGHWALLVAWAVLGWVVVGLAGLARGEGLRAWGTLVVCATVAALGSPTGGLLVGAVVVVGAALVPPEAGRRRGALRVATAVGVVALANAPWWLPSALLAGTVLQGADAAGVRLFAPRSDTVLGTWVSLLAGGGIWNAEVVPPGRQGWAAAPLVGALLVAAVAGLPTLLRRGGRPVAALTGVAAAGLAVALVSSSPAQPVLEAVVTGVPGGGLLRDAQKLVLPLVLLLALGAATSAHRLARSGRPAGAVAAAVVLVLPVLSLPTLAWGAGGRLGAVDYPAGWERAREAVRADDVPGSVMVLPWSLYRRYEWNAGRTVLTPAQRWFDRRTVTNDDLPVGTDVVRGEDRRARALADVAAAVDGTVPATPSAVAGRLRDEGVRWVLVERRTGVPDVPSDALAGLETVLDDPDVRLLRVDDPATVPEDLPPVPVAVSAHAAAGLLLALGVLLRFRRPGGTPPATVR